MDKAFFANSGTEANEAAIKLARKYWWDKQGQPMQLRSKPNPHDPSGQLGTLKRSGTLAATAHRHVILTMEGNFHGRTGHSMAAGDYRVSPYHRHGFGDPPLGYGVLSNDFQQVVTDGEEHMPLGPEWDTVAAVIMAPVLGNNVVTTYNAAFWTRLQELHEQHGFLLIFDDVQAGSGRAGHFASWQHPDCGLQPDIMTLAKGMAMGFPMSVMLAGEDIAEAFTPGTHFNTFGGSPFMCHMACKMIEWLDEHILEVRANGEYIRTALANMPWMHDVDGWGMLNAFTPDFEFHGYNGYDFIHEARKHGLSLVTHRPFGPIRFTPRLNIERIELTIALDLLAVTHNALVR
jgi:acetylornithine/succinyldiaminopimelate/putrescine aminotransferase